MLDLSMARSAAESVMGGRCRILRDVEGTTDDVLDEATGKMVRPAGDEQTVYDGIYSAAPSLRDSQNSEGGRAAARRFWQLILPVSAAPPRMNDRVWFIESSDPALVNRRLRVRKVEERSHAVLRKLWLEDDLGGTVR